MLTLFAFIAIAQFRVDLTPDDPQVALRVGAVEAAASALADRTHDLRKELPSTPPEIIERADLVAPGRLRLYASPIRFEKDGTYLPIQLAWTPGATAVMECATNTLETAITRDGWKRVSGNGWSLSTRPQGARNITVKRTDADVLTVSGLWPDGAVTEYRLMRGGVKESIILERAPESTVWTYDAKPDGGTRIELGKDGTQVLVKADGAVVAILPTPVAIDADGKRLRGTYALGAGTVSTIFDAKWFDTARYPVQVDPSVTTDQGDAAAANALGEDYYDGGDYPFWNHCFFKTTLPDMTGNTISAATFNVAPSQVGTGNTVASVYCDVVGAWTGASNAATMAALSFNAATATSISGFSADTYKSIDILGSSGTNGIAKVYADDISPDPCTVKFTRVSPTGTDDYVSGGYAALGDENTSVLHMAFYGGTSASYFPYVELTYTAAANGARGSGSVGIIGL